MSSPPRPPSTQEPLQGGCLCGAIRFEITAPFISAGYCHCTHCQFLDSAVSWEPVPDDGLTRYPRSRSA